MEQFRFSKFSLKMPQPLPDIQKGIFEIQLAGLLLRGPFPLHYGAISIFEIQFEGATTTSRYPKRNFWNSAWRLTGERSIQDLHRAISIFEIQFAGATTTSRYPKRNFRNSACRKFSLQVNCWEVLSQISICIEQFRFSKFSLQVLQLQTLPDIQKGIFEIQLGG